MSDFTNLLESVNICLRRECKRGSASGNASGLTSEGTDEQVTDEPKGREPYRTCLHVQAPTGTHGSEILQQHYIFNLKLKEKISRQTQMTCSRLHGALFESDYLPLKARDVSVKTKYSGANI